LKGKILKIRPERRSVRIEEVNQPFCGIRRRKIVTLGEAFPEIAGEWRYEKNCGW